ncbi:MAG: hypothetical protein LiPW15_98 [Parcubacteria group bacterium LiPW_15]|nr:MAG: hypothetical protein LiPW15_98 [Parcubacteria group bacterium LiPW_15]
MLKQRSYEVIAGDGTDRPPIRLKMSEVELAQMIRESVEQGVRASAKLAGEGIPDNVSLGPLDVPRSALTTPEDDYGSGRFAT